MNNAFSLMIKFPENSSLKNGVVSGQLLKDPYSLYDALDPLFRTNGRKVEMSWRTGFLSLPEIWRLVLELGFYAKANDVRFSRDELKKTLKMFVWTLSEENILSIDETKAIIEAEWKR